MPQMADPPRGVSIAEALALGEARYRAGAYVEAAGIFMRICEAAPDHAAAIRLLGLCRLRLGEPGVGLELLAKARTLAPDDPYTQLHYGLGLHAVGRETEAAAQFRLCQTLLPGDPAPFLNLATSLLGLGDASGALDAARRARRRAPKMPQAAYMVGLAFMAKGRLGDAESAFAAAIRLAPGLVDAWLNLGVARYRGENIEGAKAAMRQVLAIAPGHRAASANLGVFLRLTGEAEAGEILLRDLLQSDPEADEARVNLAADLLSEERAGEALAVLDERPAPTESRLHQHWLMQRSMALLHFGREVEARELVDTIGDVPPELTPLLLWRQALLALAEGDGETARARAEELEEALDRVSGLLPEHRIMAHFDLARFWSQQDERDRAFPQWREGHRLLGRFQPFSREAHRRFVDETITRFDNARLHGGPRAQNRDPTPVFIVGMPRSGTTLAEQIIAAHPQAFGAGERLALDRVHATLGGDAASAEARITALDQPALDHAAATYLDELRALAPGAARIVDKMPGNFPFLGLVALMLPGARIIHCVRDPRDIGLSIFTFRFYGYHPYAHDLGDLGWYIAEHDRLMAHWRAVLPNPILTLPLKDWVEDFDGTLRQVLDFLNLPSDAACGRFYEQDSRVRTVSRSQVRQPVNARGLGRWRAYESHLRPLVAALVENGVVLPVTTA